MIVINQPPPNPLGEYVVQLLGPTGCEQRFELSVVRLGHHGEKTRGQGSWGWGRNGKIIVLTGSGQYAKIAARYLMSRAESLAKELNKG